MYRIQIPMNHLINTGCDPFRIIQNGKPSLTFNECLGMLTTNFMLQHNKFPLRFNPTREYSYAKDSNYLYIEVPKASVDTRELKEGELGYIKKEKKNEND